MFALRSKGRRHAVRDPDDKVAYWVGSDWVPFAQLPVGVPHGGDGDIEVREIESDKDLKARLPVQPREYTLTTIPNKTKPGPATKAEAPRKAKGDRKATLAATIKNGAE